MALFRRRNKNTGSQVRKREIPAGLWMKCLACEEILYKKELDDAWGVCPKCGYHFQMSRSERLRMLVEPDSFEEWDPYLGSVDLLQFVGTTSYEDKLEQNVRKTGYLEAVTTGQALMDRHPVAIGVMDFSFLGASMGAAVGEKLTRLFERATERNLPVIVNCSSGGARMYEGLFSLMQMAKTSAAVERHAQARLPYVAVLTHPTMAGVMASFATQGDVLLAEPGALIGFAGPRVIKETTQQELPEGFQRSEFLLDAGLIDKVVERHSLKSTLVSLLDVMAPEESKVS